MLEVCFAGKKKKKKGSHTWAQLIPPRISSAVGRKGLCLPPNKWLRQTSHTEAVAKLHATACVCCLPWEAPARTSWEAPAPAPWELLWPRTPAGVSRAAVQGAWGDSPPPRSLQQAQLSQLQQPVYKSHLLPGQQGVPCRGVPGTAQTLLLELPRDAGVSSIPLCKTWARGGVRLGHPYQAMSASAGALSEAQREQVVQPSEGHEEMSPHRTLQLEAGELCHRSGSGGERPRLRWRGGCGVMPCPRPLAGATLLWRHTEHLLTISCHLISPPNSQLKPRERGWEGELFAVGHGGTQGAAGERQRRQRGLAEQDVTCGTGAAQAKVGAWHLLPALAGPRQTGQLCPQPSSCCPAAARGSPGTAAPAALGMAPFALAGCTPALAVWREMSVLPLLTAAARRCSVQTVQVALQPGSQSVLGF